MADLKIFDDEIHKKYTGLSNKNTIANIESIRDIPMIIRTPLICGVTATKENLRAIASLLCGKENPPAPEASIDENFEEKTYEEVYIGEENPEEIYEEVNEAETKEEPSNIFTSISLLLFENFGTDGYSEYVEAVMAIGLKFVQAFIDIIKSAIF